MKIDGIQSGLLTAAGVSYKAARHLRESDKVEAIAGLIGKFLEPAGPNFVEELVYRFLLTRGDTLGGSMRNIGGALAQRKLTRAIISCLRLSETPYSWLGTNTNKWSVMPEDDADIEINVRGLAWGRGERTLIYNLNVPFVGNNVDLCLFKGDYRDKIVNRPEAYAALGELKGGIDPAGADEHWKTAWAALTRIREAFTRHHLTPHSFFIGAAIESKMASEIWEMLETGVMENAANLTSDGQVASIARWLCSL